jgi:hypothetical protein
MQWRREEPHADVPPALSWTPPDHSADPRIHAYIDKVCAQLPRDLSPARRLELRAELAAHLRALADAYQELGSDPDTALQEALRQFGDAAQVGREWAREWKRAPRGEAPSWAVGLSLAPFLGSGLFFSALAGVSGPHGPAWWLGMLTPWIAGCCWAHLQPGQSRAFRLLALSVLLSAACTPVPEEFQGPFPLQYAGRLLLLMLWFIVACSSAGLTAALKVLRRRRQQQLA